MDGLHIATMTDPVPVSALRIRTASARAGLRLAASARRLPPSVAVFHLRARRRARRERDHFSLASAARPAELAQLLELARGRRQVVELGTGTAWTAIALALADPRRRVITFDPVARSERAYYLKLAGRRARTRLELRERPDTDGPGPGDPPVELLFIDSLHEREPVMAAFRAWREALAPRAIVVFHDYGHPEYPGVREAVGALGLEGEPLGGLFVWRAPG